MKYLFSFSLLIPVVPLRSPYSFFPLFSLSSSSSPSLCRKTSYLSEISLCSLNPQRNGQVSFDENIYLRNSNKKKKKNPQSPINSSFQLYT